MKAVIRRFADYIKRRHIPFPVSIQGLLMPYAPVKVWLRGIHEPDTTNLLKRIVQPGWSVMDVGAQHGYYTLLLASLVGPMGHVYSFEPHPRSHRWILRAVQANKFTNISAHNVGIGDEDGTKPFHLSAISPGRSSFSRRVEPGGSTIQVPSTTIDSFVKTHEIKRLDLIKVDVEGYEIPALAGMKETIKSNSGLIILFELSPQTLKKLGSTSETFLQQLRAAGLQYSFVSPSGHPQDLTDAELIARAKSHGHINLYCLLKAKT